MNCAHNVLMTGPPGSGKTLLARSRPSILPTMTVEEALRGTRRQGDKETRGGGVRTLRQAQGKLLRQAQGKLLRQAQGRLLCQAQDGPGRGNQVPAATGGVSGVQAYRRKE